MKGEDSGTGLLGCGGPGSPGGERARDSLANVLPRQDDTAGLAFETADVPLLVQGQERLAVLNLLFAPSTV